MSDVGPDSGYRQRQQQGIVRVGPRHQRRQRGVPIRREKQESGAQVPDRPRIPLAMRLHPARGGEGRNRDRGNDEEGQRSRRQEPGERPRSSMPDVIRPIADDGQQTDRAFDGHAGDHRRWQHPQQQPPDERRESNRAWYRERKAERPRLAAAAEHKGRRERWQRDRRDRDHGADRRTSSNSSSKTWTTRVPSTGNAGAPGPTTIV